MVKKFIHFRLRGLRGCEKFRTKQVGRPKHTVLTLCLRKPKKGEKPTRDRKYKSEVQRILVEKGTRTFKRDLQRAKQRARKVCKRMGKRLVRKGKEDWACS